MYYLLTNSNKKNTKCEVINTDKNLDVDIFKNIKDNSFVFTDINASNNKIKWFNNINYEDNELNKLIISKNLKLIKILKLENKTFNLIDFIIDLNEFNFCDIRDKNNKSYDISKKLKKVKNLIIVGNGPEICTGKEIDSCDYVARINTCIIEKDITGTKTNFYYKGGSHGKPDFDNMNFNSGKITSMTTQSNFFKTEETWKNNRYGNVNLNWNKIFKVLNFKYYEGSSVGDFFNKWKIGTSGSTLILLFLKKLLNTNLSYKISITGFSDYSEYSKWANSINGIINVCNDQENYYLFPDKQNFDTEYKYSNETLLKNASDHHTYNIQYFQDILLSNEIISKK